jgi:hypothetical protein
MTGEERASDSSRETIYDADIFSWCEHCFGVFLAWFIAELQVYLTSAESHAVFVVVWSMMLTKGYRHVHAGLDMP